VAINARFDAPELYPFCKSDLGPGAFAPRGAHVAAAIT